MLTLEGAHRGLPAPPRTSSPEPCTGGGWRAIALAPGIGPDPKEGGSRMELDDVLSRIAADGIEFVRFEQSDLHGISRSKTVPARHAAAFARDGLNFLLGQLGFDAQGGVAPG